MSLDEKATQRFTTSDRIGAVASGLSGLALMLFPIAGRNFASMFRDFGSAEQLPALTKLTISWWFPMVLSVPVVASLVLALRRKLPLRKRRAWIVAAFVFGSVGFAVCVIGVYLPIFMIDGKVMAE